MFKVVKNTNEVVNDDNVKVRVIQAINEYFALENWDFGDIFYFSVCYIKVFQLFIFFPDFINIFC